MASPVDCGGVVSSVWEFLPTAGDVMGSVFFLFCLVCKSSSTTNLAQAIRRVSVLAKPVVPVTTRR